MRNFFCEVDLDNLEFNIKKIKENTDKKIIAVVKGDAYGFGIEGITAFLDSYVDAFAVVTMEEALRVKSGKDVLILNPVLSADDIQKLKDNFIVSVDDTCLPEMLKAAGKNVRAHVYVDTGMNRFGVKPEELDSLIKKLNKDYPNVKVSGIYTHLHNTKDRDYTLKQIEKFKDAVKPYSGLEIHLLNSPGFLNYNDVVDFGTAIRIGNIIYGYDAEALGYKKIYSYKAIPVRTYEVKKGEYVGYGNLYRAKENDKVSILDFGNIDNFDCFKNIKHNIFYDILKVIYHHVKGRSGITYNGRDVKIIGKSNMNFTLIKNEGFPDDAVFDIDMNPIYADTSIPKSIEKVINMYNFKEIDEKTINEFNDKNEKGHIFQTSYWANVKDSWVAKYIGGYDDKDNLVLTCMLILRKIPYTGKYMGYSPRGFVCDYSNEQLIKEFTEFIKSYGKKNKAAFITFDPDIHLKEDEKPLDFGVKVRDFLVSLGYVNKEVKNFENIQPNFVFRLGIDKTLSMEDRKKALFDAFTSKTRYNIKVAEERGLSVDVYDKDNVTDEVLDKFYELMATTGKRDNFITRHREYFKNMVDYMYPYCRIYMVKYSYNKDSARLNQKIQSQQKNIERCKKKKENAENNLTKETVEDKINKLNKKIKDAESGISESEREISGFQKRLQEIEPYKGREVYVSGSVYLYYSGKGWYLYGASDNILRDTMPNFLMQWKMIQDTVDLDCYMYDFRGVSGDLNPDNPLYGLYKFKKGFNGKFVEFIGQFDVVIDGFIYGMFKTVFPQFKKIRDVIMRK